MLALLAFLLGACGGGGTGDGANPAVVGISSAASAVTSTVAGATSAVATGSTADGALTVSNAGVAPAPALAIPLQTPYLRVVLVDASASNASDTGPGTVTAPYKTITAAMAQLRPGDDVVIAAGTYRESIVVPALNWGNASTRIRALTARTVTVKGSTLVTAWTPVSGNLYATPWTWEEPEMVFNAGNALQQVGGTVFGGFPTNPSAEFIALMAAQATSWPGRVLGDQTTMAANSFYFDSAAKRLYVRLPSTLPAGQALEVSNQRHVLIADNAAGLTVDGLDFAHANTSYTYRWGAVKVMGTANLINNVAVRDMDGICVQLIGTDSALANSTIDRCGQVGVTGKGTRLRFEGNQILHGNTRGFDIWWEAGGMKLIGAGGADGLNDSVIRNNVVAYNSGNGIWVDWKNARNLIEGNTTAYNSGFGIQYEASQTGTIRNNLAYGNALRGIYLLESSNCVVQGNAVFGNAMEGIAVVDGTRSATDAMLKPAGNQVSGNTIAWNDYNRNWVQLVLPGASYGSSSDRNVLMAEGLAPRLSMGFVGSSNPAYEALSNWQAATGQDAHSTSETLPAPAEVKAAIAARRMLAVSELPAALTAPGVP
jgi:parallel beta-helix repeat protein